MHFGWTDEQRAHRDAVKAFAEKELNERLAERDRAGEFAWDAWRRCAAFGIQGMAVPEAYSGTPETDILTGTLAMEALGHGCRDNGLTFGLNAQMWTVQLPIQRHGSSWQKQHFLPPLCAGHWVGAHAMTEPDHGSDAFGMKTRARPCEGGYLLDGRKTMVTFAPVADVFLVFATLDPALGKWGITAFLLEADMPGLSVSPPREKMGLRTVPFGDVRFQECFVPEVYRLGPEGAGMGISTSSLEFERCFILASQLGAMERQLEAVVTHARERRQFGQPIGKFQSVSNRIADMKVRLEAARMLLYKVAWLKQTGQSAMMEAAILKLFLSESFVESGLDAIRVNGGRGYLTETGVERDLRDAIGGVLYAGTSDIQRNLIAGLLGL